MSKASVSFLATLLLGDLVEEEKNGNAKDVKTRQTCRYQNGDVPRTTTTSDDRGRRDDNRKREREEGKERRDNRVEQVGKTLKRAANAFIATLDSTLA